MIKFSHWSKDEDERLLRMRDFELLGFDRISAKMPGRTAAACQIRYYKHLAEARDLTPRRSGPKPVGKAIGFWRRPRIVVVPLAPKPAPPTLETFAQRGRVLSTEALREDAALRARIEICGDLTRGYFGDPPPGRSALDQRAMAPAPAAERPLSVAVSDAG